MKYRPTAVSPLIRAKLITLKSINLSVGLIKDSSYLAIREAL